MLRWIPTLWLGFFVIRYARVSYRSILTPYNMGSDSEWAVRWLSFALLFLISIAFARRAAVATWLGVFGAIGLGMVLLSSTIFPALVSLLILGICAGIGERLLRILRLEPSPLIERLVYAVPAGIGILALAQLAIALAGAFRPAVSWALLGVLALPSVSGLRSLAASSVEDGLKKHHWALVPCAFVFLLNLAWAVAPEIQFDATNVHLGVPRLYLQAGSMIELPYFFNSYFAHLLDIVFGTCLATGGAATAKFLVLELGALAAGAAYVAGNRLFHAEVGVWAAMLFYTTPVVIWSSGTTYLDLSQALFITAGALAFLKWHETSRWQWMAASGWICGVAAGVKAAAIGTLIVLPLLALIHAWRQRSPALAWPAALFLVLTIIVFAPWHAVTYAWTGNPFFPMFNKVFKSAGWPLENTRFDWGEFGIGTSWAALLRLPFWFTLDTIRFGSIRGGIGLAPLLLFPLAIRYGYKGTFPQRAMLGMIGLHALVWTFSAQYARYWVPILPMALSIGCAAFLDSLPTVAVRLNRVFLAILLAAQAPLASTLFWNIPERYPIDYAFGRETEESFLTRTITGYKAARFLNPILKPGDKILESGVGHSRLYFEAPLHGSLTPAKASGPAASKPLVSAADVHETAVRQGFAYIVVERARLKQAPESLAEYLQPGFLQLFTESLYQDESVIVFRIRPQATMTGRATP